MHDRGFLGHPRGLKTLFFTEMWERFSYYGMRAILQLFMLAPIAAGGLGLPKSESGPIYAMYTSLVYLMCIPGGWLADNILGQRGSVFAGGFVIMIGHVLLAMHGMPTFYAGLGCVIIGTGLLKPNISAIVGQLYAEKDTRREAGFSIFYMGINIGAFTAPFVCGFLAQKPWWRAQLESWGLDPRNSWHWGFGAAAVGMFFGLLQYLLTGRNLGTAGLRPTPAKSESDARQRKRTLAIGSLSFLAIAIAVTLLGIMRPELLTRGNIDGAYQVLLVLVVVAFFGRLFTAGSWTRMERNRLVVITILFVGASIFWGVFEQAGSTLTIFADESTRNVVFGYEFPSSWWQAVNAAFIVLLTPFFTWMWNALGKRNPSYPTKFGIGLTFAGLGFLWLVGGARQWTTIWSDYVAKNRDAIVAAGAKYGVEVHTEGEVRVAAVSEILAEARKQIEEELWKEYGAKDWQPIRETASKYAVELGTGEIGLSQITRVIDTAKVKIGEELFPAWERVSFIWLLVVYLLHTIGELFLSPVGLAAMTRLAPARVVGLMMGVWFLATSLGNYMGGSVSGYYDRFDLPTLLTMVAVSAFVMAGIMFALVRPIRRMLTETQVESGAAPSGH